jgi:hypothetical protein
MSRYPVVQAKDVSGKYFAAYRAVLPNGGILYVDKVLADCFGDPERVVKHEIDVATREQRP